MIARKLFDNGYKIFACRGKIPIEKGFNKKDLTPVDIKRFELSSMYTDCGFGIILNSSNLIALDADIDDNETARQLINYIKQLYKSKVLSVRKRHNSPRFAIFFTRDKSIKIDHKIVVGKQEKKEAVEVLSNWITAYGEHPSGSDYYFDSGDLTEVKIEDIPVIDKGILDDILSYYEKLSGLKEVKETLAKINYDDINNIEKVLSFLKGYFGDTDLAKNLFFSWCEHNSMFTIDSLKVFWSTQAIKPVKMYDLLELAEDFKPLDIPLAKNTKSVVIDDFESHGSLTATVTHEDAKLENFIARYAYDSIGGEVVDLYSLGCYRTLKKESFIISTNHLQAEEEVLTSKGELKTKMTPTAKMWLASPDKIITSGSVYLPSTSPSKLVTKNVNGIEYTYVNNYYTPDFSDVVSNESDADFFMDHLKYLFDEEKEAKYFTNWLAHNVQYPERMIGVAPVHISKQQGIGRSSVGKIMAKILGEDNVTSIADLNKVIKEGWGNFMHNKVLVIVNEVKDMYKIQERLKSYLTDSYQNLNLKKGVSSNFKVYANFILFSNNANCIKLTSDDRRFSVFYTDKDKKGKEYYARLADIVKNDGSIKAIKDRLMAMDLTKFNETLPMKNETRERLVMISKNPVVESVATYMRDFKFATYKEMITSIRLELALYEGVEEIHDRSIWKEVQRYKIDPFRFNGVRYWRDHKISEEFAKLNMRKIKNVYPIGK